MKQFNPYDFYTLANVLHPLTELSSARFIKDVFMEVYIAKTSLYNIAIGNPVPLTVSKSAATKLWWALDAIIPADSAKFQALNMDQQVDAFVAGNVRTIAKEFETILAAELQGASTYYVSQQGIYNTPDLIDRAENSLGDILGTIAEEPKKDFNAAGRCLAFELPTASAFHTMRATEAVLRQYHRLVIALPAATKSPEMAQCINELRAHGEDPKLLDILDHIRDLHRNTIMHPEAFLTVPEALGLFDISKSAINAMATRVKALAAIAVVAAPIPGIPPTAAVAVAPIAAPKRKKKIAAPMP